MPRSSNHGFTPDVFDNLGNGHAEFVQWGPLERGDIRDRARLDAVFKRYRPAAIVHFAGLIEVGQSVHDPAAFFENNVAGSLTLLRGAQAARVGRMVFSSTCATYGMPQAIPMDESHPQMPINPYGRSKLMVEQILSDLDAYTGFRSVVLRYFNAAGADPKGRVGEWHSPETHAIPLAIETALGQRTEFKVLGTDYNTSDGTCVRDFVHVMDLADAHTRAVRYLLDGGESVSLNLGTGRGTSVKELLSAVWAVSGKSFPVLFADRREGNSPVLVADNRKARSILGWRPHYDLDAIVQTAWNWHDTTLRNAKPFSAAKVRAR